MLGHVEEQAAEWFAFCCRVPFASMCKQYSYLEMFIYEILIMQEGSIKIILL